VRCRQCCCCCPNKLNRPQVVALCVGLTMGVLLFAGLLVIFFVALPSTSSREPIINRQRKTESDHLPPVEPAEWSLQLRRPLYIGLLTLDKYYESRALSCNRTWGQHPIFQRQARFDIYIQRDGMQQHQNVVPLEGELFVHMQQNFQVASRDDNGNIAFSTFPSCSNNCVVPVLLRECL
jgi:hypothetical protein